MQHSELAEKKVIETVRREQQQEESCLIHSFSVTRGLFPNKVYNIFAI